MQTSTALTERILMFSKSVETTSVKHRRQNRRAREARAPQFLFSLHRNVIFLHTRFS